MVDSDWELVYHSHKPKDVLHIKDIPMLRVARAFDLVGRAQVSFAPPPPEGKPDRFRLVDKNGVEKELGVR